MYYLFIYYQLRSKGRPTSDMTKFTQENRNAQIWANATMTTINQTEPQQLNNTNEYTRLWTQTKEGNSL